MNKTGDIITTKSNRVYILIDADKRTAIHILYDHHKSTLHLSLLGIVNTKIRYD